MLDQTGFYLRNKKNSGIKNNPSPVSKTLPSFHIEVSEQIESSGKVYAHRINSNTTRICSTINPSVKLDAEVLIEKIPDEPIASLNPKRFYTKIAIELSSLSALELSENFGDLRICYNVTRSQKNYSFQF